MTAYNVTAAYIVELPSVCGGRPHIVGTYVRVQDVLYWKEMDIPEDEIMECANLSRPQFYAALCFAYDREDAIRSYMNLDQKRGMPTPRHPGDAPPSYTNNGFN